MNKIKVGGGLILALLVFGGIAFGSWYVKRKINYSFMYQSLVEDTVKEMVRKECLK